MTKRKPPAKPFVLTDAMRLRAQAFDMVMRAVGVLPGWKPGSAAELTREAETLETWLKEAK